MAHRTEIVYVLWAVHVTGERRNMGAFTRYVDARVDGYEVDALPGWHADVQRVRAGRVEFVPRSVESEGGRDGRDA
jgi:hypothetical protein